MLKRPAGSAPVSPPEIKRHQLERSYSSTAWQGDYITANGSIVDRYVPATASPPTQRINDRYVPAGTTSPTQRTQSRVNNTSDSGSPRQAQQPSQLNLSTSQGPSASAHIRHNSAGKSHDLGENQDTRTGANESFDYSKVPKGPKKSFTRISLIGLPPVPYSVRAQPHIFISCKDLPVIHALDRHLGGKIAKKINGAVVKVDSDGYYILFPDDHEGRLDLENCWRKFNRTTLFNEYTLNMECYPDGQYPRSQAASAPLFPGHARRGSFDAQKPHGSTDENIEKFNSGNPVDVHSQLPETEHDNRQDLANSDSALGAAVSSTSLAGAGAARLRDHVPSSYARVQQSRTTSFAPTHPTEGLLESHPRVRGDDEMSLSSIVTPSEVSSATAKTRDQHCAECKNGHFPKYNQKMSCSTCPRRFHSKCLKPELGPGEDIIAWQCHVCIKRCRQKPKPSRCTKQPLSGGPIEIRALEHTVKPQHSESAFPTVDTPTKGFNKMNSHVESLESNLTIDPSTEWQISPTAKLISKKQALSDNMVTNGINEKDNCDRSRSPGASTSIKSPLYTSSRAATSINLGKPDVLPDLSPEIPDLSIDISDSSDGNLQIPSRKNADKRNNRPRGQKYNNKSGERSSAEQSSLGQRHEKSLPQNGRKQGQLKRCGCGKHIFTVPSKDADPVCTGCKNQRRTAEEGESSILQKPETPKDILNRRMNGSSSLTKGLPNLAEQAEAIPEATKDASKHSRELPREKPKPEHPHFTAALPKGTRAIKSARYSMSGSSRLSSLPTPKPIAEGGNAKAPVPPSLVPAKEGPSANATALPARKAMSESLNQSPDVSANRVNSPQRDATTNEEDEARIASAPTNEKNKIDGTASGSQMDDSTDQQPFKLRNGYTWSKLIAMALLDHPDKQLTANQIHQWLVNHVQGHHMHDATGRSRIHAILSQYPAFTKGEQVPDDPHKSHFWTLHPEHSKSFLEYSYNRMVEQEQAEREQGRQRKSDGTSRAIIMDGVAPTKPKITPKVAETSISQTTESSMFITRHRVAYDKDGRDIVAGVKDAPGASWDKLSEEYSIEVRGTTFVIGDYLRLPLPSKPVLASFAHVPRIDTLAQIEDIRKRDEASGYAILVQWYLSKEGAEEFKCRGLKNWPRVEGEDATLVRSTLWDVISPDALESKVSSIEAKKLISDTHFAELDTDNGLLYLKERALLSEDGVYDHKQKPAWPWWGVAFHGVQMTLALRSEQLCENLVGALDGGEQKPWIKTSRMIRAFKAENVQKLATRILGVTAETSVVQKILGHLVDDNQGDKVNEDTLALLGNVLHRRPKASEDWSALLEEVNRTLQKNSPIDDYTVEVARALRETVNSIYSKERFRQETLAKHKSPVAEEATVGAEWSDEETDEDTSAGNQPDLSEQQNKYFSAADADRVFEHFLFEHISQRITSSLFTPSSQQPSEPPGSREFSPSCSSEHAPSIPEDFSRSPSVDHTISTPPNPSLNMRSVAEDAIILAALKADCDQRPFNVKDLFKADGDLHPEKVLFDKDAKIAEIRARPTRKARFTKRLEHVRDKRDEDKLHIELERDLPATYKAPVQYGRDGESVNPRKREAPFDSSCGLSQDVEMIDAAEAERPEEFETLEELLGLPERRVPIVYEERYLAYRDGAVINGRVPRAKAIWKVGRNVPGELK